MLSILTAKAGLTVPVASQRQSAAAAMAGSAAGLLGRAVAVLVAVSVAAPAAPAAVSGCPDQPTFTPGSIGPDGFGAACALELPQYGVGDCPGPTCQSFQDYWSVDTVMKENYPNCTRADWPRAWQPSGPLLKLRGSCTVAAWQRSAKGLLCPDPNTRPLPCPGLNVSSPDGGKTIAMATCQQSGSASSGGWGGFDAVGDYLMSSAVVDPIVCGRMPAVHDTIQRFVCPVFTPQMAAEAAAYPANLPTLEAVNRTCGLLARHR